MRAIVATTKLDGWKMKYMGDCNFAAHNSGFDSQSVFCISVYTGLIFQYNALKT